MRRAAPVLALMLAATSMAACSDEPTASATGDPAGDKLAQIMDRGTLVLSTDLDYAPQSFAVADAERAAETACDPDQLTGSEVSGFDAETGKAVAEALGVEACFVAPQWVEITGGSWSDRWDLSFGSGAIDTVRMESLYVTQPYYALPAMAFVRARSGIERPEDLSGMRVGACASCTHEDYLRHTLDVPGFDGEYLIVDPDVVTYTVEGPGLDAVHEGDLDGFLCSEQVGERAIEDGLDLEKIDARLFTELATGWVDKGSDLDVETFVTRVDAIVRDLHASGRLQQLSREFFGTDYASEAAGFDMRTIEQAFG
jgi:polar amino acid transport system substrate-binding protein